MDLLELRNQLINMTVMFLDPSIVVVVVVETTLNQSLPSVFRVRDGRIG